VERIRWETKVELLESEHRRKDGRIIHTVQNVAGSFSSDGNLKQFHGYIIDNTAHKELEREMLKTQKIESVGVLAGGIAHDFNNILTGILGNINLASMSIKTPETAADKLQRAEKAALRAKDLTAQLLAFSKGGAPVKQTMSLPALLEETAQFALRGSNVRFDLSVPGGLWAVEADAGQISQVINNLIINADQAMVEGGTIKVSAGNVHVAVPCPLPLHPGNYVRISVEDDGEGIPVEHLPKVFDPYFTTKSDGNGLGLATSFAVVKNHEGHITVDSLPGQGTRFDVFLPASGEKPADEGEPSPDLRGLGERILVMDDQAEVREVASAMLEEMGCTVECAGDGEEAVESYRRALRSGRPFGAVLMDLTIPGGMGGKEAVKRIRELDPGARVIVASGYSNDPVMAEFRNHGFSAVVTKPFRIEELGRTLRSVLNQKSGARLGRAS
jgi:signal transduction histidine kinase/ActR/RegA family two-component response regulator